MTYQLFLACLDDTPSKGVGEFTVSCISTANRCVVVNPVGEKRVSEHVICLVPLVLCEQTIKGVKNDVLFMQTDSIYILCQCVPYQCND